jgi:hypothetical protein
LRQRAIVNAQVVPPHALEHGTQIGGRFEVAEPEWQLRVNRVRPYRGVLRRAEQRLQSMFLKTQRRLLSAYKYGYTMITAAEYRAWADESLKWAHEATTESEREACTKSAEVWLQSALRSERLSKVPNITTE